MKRNPWVWQTNKLLLTVITLIISQCLHADDKFELFPLVDLYPDYIADPLRATFGLESMYLQDSSITDIGKRRFFVRTGGSLPIVGSAHPGLGTSDWQVVGEAGIQGQFDKEFVADNIGWDGIFSVYYARRFDARSIWRIGIKHISSHVGDELIERTGRVRINYTREEVRLGMTYNLDARLLTYVDGGYAYNLSDKPLQAPWRLQLGMQLERPNCIWENRLGWYAAMDLSSYEENDWRRNLTLQLGLSAQRRENTWRVGIEYYHGRSLLGEFFQDHEQYIGYALWIDI